MYNYDNKQFAFYWYIILLNIEYNKINKRRNKGMIKQRKRNNTCTYMITIIILLILAGVTLSNITEKEEYLVMQKSRNNIWKKSKQWKLELVLIDLQSEKDNRYSI